MKQDRPLQRPKDRVRAALAHQEGPTPIYMWYHGDVTARIAARRGRPAEFADVELLGNDIVQTWLNINREMARPIPPGQTYTDVWGVTWEHAAMYNQVVAHPLAGADDAAIEAYRFPDAQKGDFPNALDRLIARYGQTHYVGADISGCIFEPCYHIRGMSELLTDLAMESPAALGLLDRATDFAIELANLALNRSVDWVWMGDDQGSQDRMILGPDLWRQIFKPRMRRLIEAIRKRSAQVTMAYHSCGAIRPIIPDLIEIGVQVLNPLQPLATGMDPFEIKREFGRDLSLMGGLDTQELMRRASPKEVYDHSRRLLDALSRGGGFVFAASHTIQPDVSDENIRAMLDAACDHNGWARFDIW